MIHRITLALLCLTIIASCRKKNQDPEGVNDYAQLKPGNYWIYQTFRVGDTSVFNPPSQVDSIYVEKDTTIRGNIYHKLVENYGGEITYLRDSSDYLVNHIGQVQFSANDFTNTFFTYYMVRPGVGRNDSVGLFTRKMADRDLAIAVPAGNFITVSMRETLTLHPDNVVAGLATRVRDIRYSKGVGKVSEVIPPYLADPGYTERRLLKYHIVK